MSVNELQKLRARVEKEIESRNKKQRGKAMDEIKSIVAKYGLKLDEVMGKPVARKPRNEVSKTAAKPAKKQAAILYRHPEHPALTWSGGRGRPPQWIKDWKVSGRNLDEARVRECQLRHPELPYLSEVLQRT
jgi:DNA-binding protein H-NS